MGSRRSVSHKLALAAPFQYFGGKSRIASEVWKRLGAVDNYVDPFFGSGAMLLAVPHDPGRLETVNDLDSFLANFWRATQYDPDEVAAWTDWPVNETDKYARHVWLVTEGRRLVNPALLEADPGYFNAQVAGWWLWGISQWIGNGWCAVDNSDPVEEAQRVTRQIPHMGGGEGIHARGRREDIPGYLRMLRDRFRFVRVACGDWTRVLTPAVTTGNGITAVFLDPPYIAEGRSKVYSHDDNLVAGQVRDWAVANGDNPKFRIALCGYEEAAYNMPSTWQTMAWKATGGYGSQAEDGVGRANSVRERVWFSPHCMQPLI